MSDPTATQQPPGFCPSCGAAATNPEGAFCGDCGASLTTGVPSSHASSVIMPPSSVDPPPAPSETFAAPSSAPMTHAVVTDPYQSPPGAVPPGGTFTCPRCGQPQPLIQNRMACQSCGQVRTLPNGVTLTPASRRFGQYLLDTVLAVVTLGIGYLIWSLIIWSQGQTPGMQVMHIKTVKRDTGSLATWGTMCVRQLVGEGIIMGLISVIFFPAWIVLCFMLLWDRDRQQLWDKIAGTIVVDHYDNAYAMRDVALPEGT